MNHPYAALLGFEVEDSGDGRSTCRLSVAESHYNPLGVVHGGVLYSLADTGMGAALFPSLQPGEICATIEIKMNYYRPVRSGEIRCLTEVLYQGKRVANLESSLYVEGRLVGKANGSYSIFRLEKKPEAGQ
jgi:acyl-CoA thioesterase